MHYYDILKPTECTGPVFDRFLSLGWYPMGQSIFTTSHLYREEDRSPQRVFWLRYPVEQVKEKASHRRILRLNRSFKIELKSPFEHSDELDNLYDIYLDHVDFDGYPSIERASGPRNSPNIFVSRSFLVKERETVIACGIFYEGSDSIASILHFYDPDYRKYSPGKFLILLTLQYCRDKGFQWYYPGYIIQGNSKMDYKLFLGEDAAEYYDPEPHPLTGSWRSFSQDLLQLKEQEGFNTP